MSRFSKGKEERLLQKDAALITQTSHRIVIFDRIALITWIHAIRGYEITNKYKYRCEQWMSK